MPEIQTDTFIGKAQVTPEESTEQIRLAVEQMIADWLGSHSGCEVIEQNVSEDTQYLGYGKHEYTLTITLRYVTPAP